MSNGPCASLLILQDRMHIGHRLPCMQVVFPMAMWSPTYLTRWDAHVGSPHCWGLQGPCVITVTPTLLSLLSVNKMVNGNNHSAEEEPVFLAIPADCHVTYLVHLLFTITRTAAPLSTIMFLHRIKRVCVTSCLHSLIVCTY